MAAKSGWCAPSAVNAGIGRAAVDHFPVSRRVARF